MSRLFVFLLGLNLDAIHLLLKPLFSLILDSNTIRVSLLSKSDEGEHCHTQNVKFKNLLLKSKDRGLHIRKRNEDHTPS